MNFENIKELLSLFDNSNIVELNIEEGDTKLYLSKKNALDGLINDESIANIITSGLSCNRSYTASPMPIHTAQHMPQGSMTTSTQAAVLQQDSSGKTVESPMIGTFYSASSPGAEPFVKVGDVVEKGQTLCIIEAMKIMNTIEAEYRCRIVSALVDDGKPVEFGQSLYIVEPI